MVAASAEAPLARHHSTKCSRHSLPTPAKAQLPLRLAWPGRPGRGVISARGARMTWATQSRAHAACST